MLKEINSSTSIILVLRFLWSRNKDRHAKIWPIPTPFQCHFRSRFISNSKSYHLQNIITQLQESESFRKRQSSGSTTSAITVRNSVWREMRCCRRFCWRFGSSWMLHVEWSYQHFEGNTILRNVGRYLGLEIALAFQICIITLGVSENMALITAQTQER
jgi:hypothetical protein